MPPFRAQDHRFWFCHCVHECHLARHGPVWYASTKRKISADLEIDLRFLADALQLALLRSLCGRWGHICITHWPGVDCDGFRALVQLHVLARDGAQICL